MGLISIYTHRGAGEYLRKCLCSCTCMYMCKHRYTWMYVHMIMCMRRQVHIRTHAYMCTCMYRCTHVHVHACAYVCIWVHTCAYARLCVCVCIRMHTCACVRAHVYTCPPPFWPKPKADLPFFAPARHTWREIGGPPRHRQRCGGGHARAGFQPCGLPAHIGPPAHSCGLSARVLSAHGL